MVPAPPTAERAMKRIPCSLRNCRSDCGAIFSRRSTACVCTNCGSKRPRRYRLYWLTPGNYMVAVEYSGGACQRYLGLYRRKGPISTRSGLPTFITPHSRHIQCSGNPHRRLLEVPGIDFNLSHKYLASLNGIVQNLPGSAHQTDRRKPRSSLRLDSQTGISLIVIDPIIGKFLIRNVAGIYFMQAVANGSNISLRSPSVRVEVGTRDVDNIIVPLFPKRRSLNCMGDGLPAAAIRYEPGAALFQRRTGTWRFLPSRIAPDGTLIDAVGFPEISRSNPAAPVATISSRPY
jgi:hypothetical protein